MRRLLDLTEQEFRTTIENIIDSRLSVMVKPVEDDEYMSRQEVANKLHISLPTLGEWVKDGMLSAYKINSRVLFKKAEVSRAVDNATLLKIQRSSKRY